MGIAFLSGLISDMVTARSDPNVGTMFDLQICAMADVLATTEELAGGKSGKRRALKSKSGAFLGIVCPGSGKSGKSYAPTISPALTYLKSGKTYAYTTGYDDYYYSAKSAKSAKYTTT